MFASQWPTAALRNDTGVHIWSKVNFSASFTQQLNTGKFSQSHLLTYPCFILTEPEGAVVNLITCCQPWSSWLAGSYEGTQRSTSPSHNIIKTLREVKEHKLFLIYPTVVVSTHAWQTTYWKVVKQLSAWDEQGYYFSAHKRNHRSLRRWITTPLQDSCRLDSEIAENDVLNIQARVEKGTLKLKQSIISL